MTIIDTFKELQAIYERLDPPLLARFQPGASEDQIREAEEKIGVQFPDELRELMRYANGQASMNDQNSPYEIREEYYGIHPVFPAICYTSDRSRVTDWTWWAGLDDLVEQTQSLRQQIIEMGDETYEEIGPVRCHLNMIGFTTTENASSLMIDLEPKSGGTIGQVVMVATQPTIVAVLAPSLHSFLTFVKDGFASGLFECRHPGYGIWRDKRFAPAPYETYTKFSGQ